MSMCFYFICFATSYEGIVSKKKSKVTLFNEANGEAYVLDSSSPTVINYLSKLTSGDYISLDGTLNEKKKSLTVNSISYMGLKSLLGLWVGDDSHCYNFINFTEFVISTRARGNKCAPPVAAPGFIYTYTVNPTSNTWTLLISGERSSFIGDLKFKNSSDAQIELFDSETGDTLRSLNLKR